jgi:hypothetical protein
MTNSRFIERKSKQQLDEDNFKTTVKEALVLLGESLLGEEGEKITAITQYFFSYLFNTIASFC